MSKRKGQSRGQSKGRGGSRSRSDGRPTGKGTGSGRSGKGGGRGKSQSGGRGSGGGKAQGGGRGSGGGKSQGSGDRRSSGGRQSSAKGLGGDQVEGVHAVRELLIAGRRKVREVVIEEGADDRAAVADIVELAAGARVPVYEESAAKLRQRAHTDTPQGVLAAAKPLEETELSDLAGETDPEALPGAASARRREPPFLLAFDGVTDPGNLGAALRSAEGAGVSGIVLPRHRSVRISPTVAKAAAGAIEYLPFAVVGGIPAALDELKRHGVWVVGLDEAGDGTIYDVAVADEPVCLVVGAEGAGLGRLTRARCDLVTRIPLYGNVPSLNVSVAAALATFEVRRRRGG